MANLSRREILLGAAASAAALGVSGAAAAATLGNPPIASFGNPDLPPEGKINDKSPSGLDDPGPQNPALAGQFPSFQDPPATDVNGMQLFWSSFNNAHRRYQNGGWAREVTQEDFAISKDFAGVNMRLGQNGIRELHWHQQSEWAIVTDGVCRISILDEQGRPQVADVKTGDLWFFPPGLPHSLMGVGPTGSEFMLGFDNGMASEFNTLLLTDFMAHMPPEVLAKNFGMPADVFKNIPLNNLWIFQGTDPGPLGAAQQASQGGRAPPPHPYVWPFSTQEPDYVTKGGSMKIVDSSKFTVSTTTAAALVTIRPGGIRELHWHPNADEWQYWIKGRGRMTVFDTGPKAATADFRAGDIGYVKKSLGHYVENTGDTDCVFLGLFKTDRYQEVSLSDWLTHSPPEMVKQTLNISGETLAKIPRSHPGMMPR
jgi:oxalate decarboxylase